MTMIPVILSGGSGTRLWPVSREAYPKPFIRLAGGPSLLQRVLGRCAPLCDKTVYIVTNETYGFKTREEAKGVPALGGRTLHQILEPTGRNTAPAIALAALNAAEHGDDPILLVLPADTLGAHKVNRFVEKPDVAKATEFLAAGNFVWNSGMFCFKASAILAALDLHAPELMAAARQVWTAGRKASATGDDEVRFDAAAFATMPDISIDYAVMEKASNIALVRADFHWSDIGSWKAVAEQLPADADGNTSVGEHLMVQSRNTHVQSDDRLIAAVGVDNLLIIDTPDAVLVANKDASQQVKEVVAKLRHKGHSAATLHRTVARPWGTYTVLHEGPRFKMKEIVVKPEQTLSLQMHHHRSEHWIVVANQSTYIPIGAKHRLENPGKVDLMLIEVQCGDYVGEDDIVRFDDRYGRVESK